MTRRRVVRCLVAVALAASSIGLGAGCGGDDEPAVFAVSDAWSRTTPEFAANGVVYLAITTDVDDELVGAEVDPDIAAATELHASSGGDGSGGHVHGAVGGDVASMEEVSSFPLAAGDVLEFAPGGNHVMLVGLSQPLERGRTFELRLRFASGRSLTAEVVVADNPPADR